MVKITENQNELLCELSLSDNSIIGLSKNVKRTPAAVGKDVKILINADYVGNNEKLYYLTESGTELIKKKSAFTLEDDDLFGVELSEALDCKKIELENHGDTILFLTAVKELLKEKGIEAKGVKILDELILKLSDD